MTKQVASRKTKLPKIHGVSKVNHHLRVQLGLNCSEYILAQCMYDLVTSKEPVLASTIFRRIGFAQGEQIHYAGKLIEKGIIFPNDGKEKDPKFTKKWLDVFVTKEEEFKEFWTLNGKTCWPGSKPKALDLYTKMRRNYSKEYIIEQRNQYFRHLELVNKYQFDRSKMMATVFLGPQERIHEEWKEMADELQNKYEPSKKEPAPSSMTKETKDKLYGENSD